jgi:hypothetical protein
MLQKPTLVLVVSLHSLVVAVSSDALTLLSVAVAEVEPRTSVIRFQKSKPTAGGATWQKSTKKSRQDNNKDAYLHGRSRSTR